MPTMKDTTLLPLTTSTSPLLSSTNHPLNKKLGLSVVDAVVVVGVSLQEMPPKIRGALAVASGSLSSSIPCGIAGLITCGSTGMGATVDLAATVQVSSNVGLIFSGVADVTVSSMTCVIVPDAIVDSETTTI